ncbi:MAG: hypothetical protein GKS06_10985 [Acidobacteria bacterium]|nr:hypothetical protein [Acidobacteriota bacterium]
MNLFKPRSAALSMSRLFVAASVIFMTLPGMARAQHGGILEVPLAMSMNHLAVPVMAADGTELQFMLSTGTPSTLISESAAAKGAIADLMMAGLPIGNDAQVIPDANLEVDGHQFDGIVSASILSSYDVLLDVPKGRMMMRPLGPPAEWQGVELGEPVALRIFHGFVMATDLQLNGHDYMAQFEIGINKVIVNEPVTQTLGFEGETIGAVTVAGREFGGLPVSHMEIDVFERWDPDGNGFVLLGAPIARDCAIAISWIRAELQVCAQ